MMVYFESPRAQNKLFTKIMGEDLEREVSAMFHHVVPGPLELLFPTSYCSDYSSNEDGDDNIDEGNGNENYGDHQ